MDETPVQNPIPAPSPTPPPSPVVQASVAQAICPQCHQPVRPEYYFCPNCGKKLSEPGLPTGVGAQVMLYAFSIVLPIMCFLAVSYWQGIKYARSADPKAQEIGWIAIALLALSTIITFWITSVWISGFIASQTSTAGLSAYGI
jgi:hypothetical protein